MTDNKNSPRTGTPIAKKLIEAASHEVIKIDKGGDYGESYGRTAAKLLNEATCPLTELESKGIGAGGEMMLNMPMAPGDYKGRQLRDTVKDPTMITATAQLARLRLAEEAGALDLGIDTADTIQPKNSLEKMMAHEMASLHTLAMRMSGNANHWLDKAIPNEYRDPSETQFANIEATRAATATAKMMQVFLQGMLTLQRIRSGGQQKVTVVHQHVQVAGGHVAVAGAITEGVNGDNGEK